MGNKSGAFAALHHCTVTRDGTRIPTVIKFSRLAEWMSWWCSENIGACCAAFSGWKGVKRPLKVRRCWGRDFSGLCQLSTRGGFNRRGLWVIAELRMCLIWRQHFAVGWDLLARAWEEQLAQKVHCPRWSNRWSKGRRDGCGAAKERVVDVKPNLWPLGFTGSFHVESVCGL